MNEKNNVIIEMLCERQYFQSITSKACPWLKAKTPLNAANKPNFDLKHGFIVENHLVYLKLFKKRRITRGPFIGSPTGRPYPYP
jgi:hypothetical protein